MDAPPSQHIVFANAFYQNYHCPNEFKHFNA